MSLYSQFKTRSDLELDGVTYELRPYNCRVTLARAGGSNVKFNATIAEAAKPYRRLLQAGAILDRDTELAILRKAYAGNIIRAWETLVKGPAGEEEWKPGIEAPDGSLLPFTKENVLATLEALPDFFMELVGQASNLQNYLEADREASAGN